MKRKILEITAIMLFCSCQTNQEGIDYIHNGDRTYDIAFMSGHGYFVPVYKSNYLPRHTSKPELTPFKK